ncbi:MAG: ATP-binding protein, partial [Bacteroidota bacterium]|nr:ATP-binding protein [Bacteroidota bacterium]
GIESPVVKFQVFIQPYFWESRWFAAVLVLVLVLAAWTAYRIRVAELKRRQAELKSQIEAATIEIKEQSGRLRQIQDVKLNFYTNISHEFRTPLTLIAGPVNNLIRHNSILTVDERLKSLQLISRNTERMLRLVNQLLDLSKLDEGLFKLTYSKVNVSEQARKIYELFVPLARQHRIDFKFNAPAKLEVCIDPDVCEKILYNLLSNAFKFTPDGQTIELAITDKGKEQVCIIVRDTGRGIESEDLRRIFDRFSQGASSAMKAGTGIGLAYVKKLAELHGGQVDVESVKDCGSAFTVLLATVPDVENQKSLAPTGVDSRPPIAERLIRRGDTSRPEEDDRMKILVIDDNDDVREFIHSCLRSSYAVMQACDGREGFDLAISSVPELIVSDVMMPALNGLELCSKLKANEITSHIPVILLTAKAAEYHQAEGYRNGADSYITKPFTCDVLLARIDNLIAGRRRLRNLHFKSAFLEKNESAGVHPESEFLRKCSQFVCENLDNPKLDSGGFCKYMGMSQTQLYRKLVAVTGMPIGDFIQSYRLRQALSLLKSGRYTVSEVAYRVGFKDPSYFTKCFSRHFHFTPSKYLKNSADQEQRKIHPVEISLDLSKEENP